VGRRALGAETATGNTLPTGFSQPTWQGLAAGWSIPGTV